MAKFEAFAEKIVNRLLRLQQREITKDTGHGYQTTRKIAESLGISKKEAVDILNALARDGRIRRVDFSNGLFWRSINPLPWEPGGKWPGQAEQELREMLIRRAVIATDLATLDAAIAAAIERNSA